MSDAAGARHPVVALTGATGFIGTALQSQLIAAGFHIRALYRPRRGRVLSNTARLSWVPGDIADRNALSTLVTGADAVIHCAGSVRGARRADFDRVNEQGVLHAVQAANRACGCRRFLLLSSLAAREPQLSDYACSKRLGERALEANAGDLRWSVLRPPAVYGPGDREMRPLFQSMARGVAPIPGDGGGRFSLLHVADLASAVLAWLKTDCDSNIPYELDDGHVGGYDWDTVLAIASRVLRGHARIHRLLLPVPLLRIIGSVNIGAARIFGYAPMLTPGKVRELTHGDWVCAGRAFEQATGWRPAYGLERGLADMFGKSLVAQNQVH